MTREPLRSVDAAWLNMDRPKNTADIVGMMSFAGPLRFDRLRRLVETRLLVRDRFRQRIVPSGLLGAPVWEEDPRFSLQNHLVRERLRKLTPDALQTFVGEVATEPLDPAHPPWQFHLLQGPDGSVLVSKLHHCLADGFALMSVLLSFADGAPPDAAPDKGRLPTFRDLGLRQGADAIRGALRDAARAASLVGEAMDFARSAARMIALPRDPETILSRPLSGVRRTAWTHGVQLADLRAAARRVGATVNDILVAALAGALRGRLAASGDPVDEIEVRAMVPVNLRAARPTAASSDAEALGNQFGLAFLELPISIADARERLETVKARTAAMKQSPDAVVAYAILGALGYTPQALERLGTEFFSRKASLVITNVPGPRTPLRIAGQALDHLMFWVPHPATLGLGVSLLSYAGEVRVGVRADVAVLPDPSDLVARFEGELVALGALPAPVPGPTLVTP